MTIDICQIENKEQWLAWRRQDVTASEIAVLAGHSTYKTPLRLWAEKTGVVDQPDETRAMTRGRWMEASVLEALRETEPTWQIDRCGIYVRDPELRLGCTPDATAIVPIHGGTERIAVEAKTVARPIFEGWDGELPMTYQLQALTQLMLLDLPRAVVPVLVVDMFGCDLHVFHVERHPGAEARIRELVQEFWHNVEMGFEPKARKGDLSLVKELYPPDKGEPLDLSGDNYLPEALNIRAALKAEIKEKEELVAGLEAEIITKLNGATLGVLPGWKITNKMQHKKEYVSKAVDYPVLRISRQEGPKNDILLAAAKEPAA